jgi:hypothetical protein
MLIKNIINRINIQINAKKTKLKMAVLIQKNPKCLLKSHNSLQLKIINVVIARRESLRSILEKRSQRGRYQTNRIARSPTDQEGVRAGKGETGT